MNILLYENDLQDTYYHVFNRGVNKQQIYLDDQDRYVFLKYSKKAFEKYDIEVMAFCLMGNHYHYMLKANDDKLSASMHLLGLNYSRYFLQRYKSIKKDGRTFRGPYKKQKVNSSQYKVNLLFYIHNNPVKDEIVPHPDDFKFSSYRSYLNRKDYFSFVNIDDLKDIFVKVPRKLNFELPKFINKSWSPFATERNYSLYEIKDFIDELELSNDDKLRLFIVFLRNHLSCSYQNISDETELNISKVYRIIKQAEIVADQDSTFEGAKSLLAHKFP